jgi:hypothetical protein
MGLFTIIRMRAPRTRAVVAAALAAIGVLTHAPNAIAECGWTYPRDLPLPETNARYWRLSLTVPPRGSIEIEGAFPYARQMGFNIHRASDTGALASLIDERLRPIGGVANPFRSGAPRLNRSRAYRAIIARSDSTLSEVDAIVAANPNDPLALRILYRIYLPDRDRPGGGVALPRVFVTDGEGVRTHVAGGGDCPRNGDVDPTQPVGVTAIPTGPGALTVPLDWRNVVSISGDPTGDVFVNRDNSYAYALTEMRADTVLVLSGRSPTHPRTRERARRMRTGEVRYWSLCAYRHPSDRSARCLADEDITRGGADRYIVAVSLAGARPRNARPGCGAAWLEAPGEGAGALFLRHVAPAPDFAFTPQRGERFAHSATVMGPYLPESRVMTLAEFEALGCRELHSRLVRREAAS